MDFKRLLPLAMLATGFSSCAFAQLGVYGNVSGERVTNVSCFTGNNPSCPASGTDQLIGGGGGIYYDFMNLGPVRLGADVRADMVKSNKSATIPLAGKNSVRMDGAFGGVRASFHTPIKTLHPYVEGAVGWNRRVNPQAYATYDLAPYGSKSYFAYRAYFGLDIGLLPFMDVRIPELGIGQNIGTGGENSNGVQSVSVGVVFHMPRGK